MNAAFQVFFRFHNCIRGILLIDISKQNKKITKSFAGILNSIVLNLMKKENITKTNDFYNIFNKKYNLNQKIKTYVLLDLTDFIDGQLDCIEFIWIFFTAISYENNNDNIINPLRLISLEEKNPDLLY